MSSVSDAEACPSRATDVVHPSSDLGRYRLVIVPTLYLMMDAAAANVAAAAAAGATVLVAFFSGIVDEVDHIRPGGYPGALRDLLGVRVEEFAPLIAGDTLALDDGSTGTLWSELLTLRGAESVVAIADGALRGVPAVTRNVVSKGAAWYLATRLLGDDLDRLLGRVLSEAGVRPPYDCPRGVELVRRTMPGASYLFAVNHRDEEVSVAVGGHDLVSDAATDGRLLLAPGAVGVVRETHRAHAD